MLSWLSIPIKTHSKANKIATSTANNWTPLERLTQTYPPPWRKRNNRTSQVRPVVGTKPDPGTSEAGDNVRLLGRRQASHYQNPQAKEPQKEETTTRSSHPRQGTKMGEEKRKKMAVFYLSFSSTFGLGCGWITQIQKRRMRTLPRWIRDGCREREEQWGIWNSDGEWSASRCSPWRRPRRDHTSNSSRRLSHDEAARTRESRPSVRVWHLAPTFTLFLHTDHKFR